MSFGAPFGQVLDNFDWQFEVGGALEPVSGVGDLAGRVGKGFPLLRREQQLQFLDIVGQDGGQRHNRLLALLDRACGPCPLRRTGRANRVIELRGRAVGNEDERFGFGRVNHGKILFGRGADPVDRHRRRIGHPAHPFINTPLPPGDGQRVRSRSLSDRLKCFFFATERRKQKVHCKGRQRGLLTQNLIDLLNLTF